MGKLVRAINILFEISGHFCGWLVPAMMLLVLVEVIVRNVGLQPPMIADEFSAYMLVALSIIGLAYTWRDRGHVRIEAVIDRLPVRVSMWLRLVTLIIALAFCLMLSKVSYDFLQDSFETRMRAGSWLLTPLQGPHMTMVIGFSLLSLMLILETVKAAKRLRAPQALGEKAI